MLRIYKLTTKDKVFDLINDDAFDKIEIHYSAAKYTAGLECSDKQFAFCVSEHKLKHYFFALRKGKDITQMIWKELEPKFEKL